MKIQTNEIEGKTIFKYKFDGSSMLLSFTDGTFSVIHGRCYYDSDIELEFEDFYWCQWESWLVELEICTGQELLEFRREAAEKLQKSQDEANLREFNRLKALLGK